MSDWTAIDWAPHVHDADIGGRALRYVDYGEGPPLLLIHGLGGCWQWWLECLPRLAERHRVIAVDLPGFGHSDELPDAAEMHEHADALCALLDQLGVDRVTVGGHSMGGLVCVALATEHPERIERVLMINAGGVPMTAVRLTAVTTLLRGMFAVLSRKAVIRAIVRRPGLRKRFMLGGPRSQTMSPQLASELIPLMPSPGFMTAIAAASRAVTDTAPEKVAQPVSLIWGDRDPIVTVANARDMERRLPDARLTLIEGVSHSPMIEAPGELVEAMLA